MIPRPDIAQWQEHAHLKSFFQVEQDLLISRTLVALFSDDILRENIAFRGGTAAQSAFKEHLPTSLLGQKEVSFGFSIEYFLHLKHNMKLVLYLAFS